jgi:hypothetical protein
MVAPCASTVSVAMKQAAAAAAAAAGRSPHFGHGVRLDFPAVVAPTARQRIRALEIRGPPPTPLLRAPRWSCRAAQQSADNVAGSARRDVREFGEVAAAVLPLLPLQTPCAVVGEIEAVVAVGAAVVVVGQPAVLV